MSLSHQLRRYVSAPTRSRPTSRQRNRRLLTALECLEPRVVLAGDIVSGLEVATPPDGAFTGQLAILNGLFYKHDEDATVNVAWSIYQDYTWNFNLETNEYEFVSYEPDGQLSIGADGQPLDPLLTNIDPADVTFGAGEEPETYVTSAQYTPAVGGSFLAVLTVTDANDPTGIWRKESPLYVNSVGLEVSINPITDPLQEGADIALSADVQGSLMVTYVWAVYQNTDGNPGGDVLVDFSSDANYIFTPPDDGEYEIRLTVQDLSSGVIGSDTATIVVENVAPVVGPITGPAEAIPGFPIAFSGAATGASVDTITTSWEIRNADNNVVASGSGSAIDYTPSATGNYTVTFTAIDDDGTVVSQSSSLSVKNHILVGGQLTIGASAGGTTVSIASGAGGLALSINGVASTVIPGVTSIVIYGQGGNDTFVITGNINVPITIDAGAGNDTILIASSVTSTVVALGGLGNDILIGGGGHNILVGGAGNDALTGGNQRDLLIGGDGVDILLGNSQDDILVAGTTDHDNSPQTLRDILGLWLATTNFQTRIASLSGLLNSSTVHDDGDIDILLGLGGNDWFLANYSGGSLFTRDLLLDANGNEINRHLEL